MTTHKAIRDATEEGPFYTAMVAKDDLRALLADLDAKTAEVERYRITQGYGAVIGGDKEVKAGATLKGTP